MYQKLLYHLQKQGNKGKVEWEKNTVSYFQHVEFEVAFNHAKMPRRHVEIDDYKLKDMSVLDIEFCERRWFVKVQPSPSPV